MNLKVKRYVNETSNCEQHTLGMASQPAEPSSKESYRCPWLCFIGHLTYASPGPCFTQSRPKFTPSRNPQDTSLLSPTTLQLWKRNHSSPQKLEGVLTFAGPWVSWSWVLAGGLPLLCTLGMTCQHQRKGEGRGRRKEELPQMFSSKFGMMVHTHNPSRRIPSLNELLSELKATLGEVVSKENKRWCMPLI